MGGSEQREFNIILVSHVKLGPTKVGKFPMRGGGGVIYWVCKGYIGSKGELYKGIYKAYARSLNPKP